MLAQVLRRIGVPDADLIELFDRMVFNALVGNDDDHPRNHAAVYDAEQASWRLSPAFDVVPNPEETPRALSMQVSAGCFEIGRAAILADARYFGMRDPQQAIRHLDALLQRVEAAFFSHAQELPDALRSMMTQRLADGLRILRT